MLIPLLRAGVRFPASGFAFCLVALAAQATNAQEAGKATHLPIRRVVMFSSGVAFFEHRGEIDGSAEIEMKFNAKDINDLLKSMVLQDEGGGRISTISYASKDPITRTLATFSIDLTQNPTLADLLNQIRGEQIELDAPAKTSGTILGVEKRQVPAGKEGATVEAAFLNLLTDDGLRSLALDGIGRIRLKNAELDAELRKALVVLATSKSQDKKSVALQFLGQGKRPVRVGYVQEAPIWKTSYRLVLGEDKPFLQGWAIVENTTEADWNDVDLTLVSGRPISFVMDLYEPLYVERPEVKPELYASLRPRTYDQDLARKDADFEELAAGRPQERTAGRESLGRRSLENSGMAGGTRMAAVKGVSGGESVNLPSPNLSQRSEHLSYFNFQRGVQSLAEAGDVGELFRYQIATPVKLARGKSALLPIVNESVQGDKVAIYNEQTQAKHPLNGLRLKNSTALHLMQGPITVFDDGAYAGDAQIQDLPPGSQRLIGYALDLDTEVAPSVKQSPATLVSVRLNKGTLEASYKHARAKSFLIKNSGKKAKQVLVEYRIDQPWQLVEPKEPTEKTRELYRFAVEAKPGVPATLTVKEEHTQREDIALTNLDDRRTGIFLSARQVSDDVKKALREVVSRKQAIERAAKNVEELERQIAVIDAEQKRIRENMAQLPRDSDLFRRYVTKFTQQEDQVDSLRQQITAAKEEVERLQKSLDEFLANLKIG